MQVLTLMPSDKQLCVLLILQQACVLALQAPHLLQQVGSHCRTKVMHESC